MIRIIAEIASAHEGRMTTMLSMIDAAARAGCDAVKFQIFRAKELVAEDHPKFGNYCMKEYSPQQWIQIADHARSANIEPVAEVFDVPSVDIAVSMRVSAYKVHSSVLADRRLITRVAGLGTTIYLSTGGATRNEIEEGIRILQEGHSNNRIVLMHGFQNFPTQLKDLHLSKIRTLQDTFGLPVGIQDHVAGESPMAFHIPMMGLAMGCVCIEKHFTLDRSLRESDYFSSLNPDELIEFVKAVRDAETAMGSPGFEMSQEEITYRELLKKSLYASRDIKKGEPFTLENICFKRSLESDRILSDQFHDISAKKAAVDITANSRIIKSMIHG